MEEDDYDDVDPSEPVDNHPDHKKFYLDEHGGGTAEIATAVADAIRAQHDIDDSDGVYVDTVDIDARDERFKVGATIIDNGPLTPMEQLDTQFKNTVIETRHDGCDLYVSWDRMEDPAIGEIDLPEGWDVCERVGDPSGLEFIAPDTEATYAAFGNGTAPHAADEHGVNHSIVDGEHYLWNEKGSETDTLCRFITETTDAVDADVTGTDLRENLQR